MQNQSTEDLDLLTRLATDHVNLTDPEFYRGYYLCRVLFRRMEHDFFQYQSGTFDSKTWEAYLASFLFDVFGNPAIRVMWQLQSDFVNPDFRDQIQPLIDDLPMAPPENLRGRYDKLLKDERGRK